MTGDMAEVPPPLPLYTFPRSQTPDAPPMTGFAHSLPVVRHRTSTGKGPSRRGGALREPLQDPRRGLLLAHWFGVRDREEAELSQAKLDREAKRRQAEMAALQLSHLGLAAAAGDGGPLSVEGVGVGDSDGPTAVQQTASAVAAFLAQQRDERESRRRDAQPPEPGEREPPSRRLVYDTADRDGLSVDRRDDDLEFDSWFESGNLRAAWRVEGRRQAGGRGDAHRPGLPSHADHEYDLLCNKDTHTNGHVQWFYFSVRRTDGLNVGPYEQPSPEAKRPLRVRLNIVNMMKKNSLYALGMLPVGFCERADARRGYGWTRVGEDVCYFRNTRTYPKRCRGPDVGKEGRFSGTTLDPTGAKESKNARHHYTLSFTVELASPLDAPRRGDSTSADDDSDSPGPVGPGEQSSDDAGRWRAAAKLGARVSPARRSSHGSPPKRSPKATRGQGDDRVFLAHCYPYTYSDLRRELQALDDRPGPSVVRRRRLCSTLAGNDCDLLTVTNFDTRDPRAVRDRAGVVLTARVHPGESNASFMMRGCVEFLTSNDPLAKQLREQFVFKIVPMMNPDGVINGNYRSSLAGEDLNRRYASPSATLQPTVHAVKQLLKATHEARGVIFYCDMHGHSRKKNIFFYGCSEAKMAPPPPADLVAAMRTAAGLAGPGDCGRFTGGNSDGTFSNDHKVMARIVPRIANNLNGVVADTAPHYGGDWTSTDDDDDDDDGVPATAGFASPGRARGGAAITPGGQLLPTRLPPNAARVAAPQDPRQHGSTTFRRGAPPPQKSPDPNSPGRRAEKRRARKRARVAWAGGAAQPAGTSGGALFSFRDNSFSVQGSKRSTGRVVAWRELGISNSFTLEASFCSPGYNEEQAMLTTAEKAYALIAKDGDDAGGRHGRGAAARSTLAAAAAAARDRASLLADRSAASSASFYAQAAGRSGLRGFSALGDLETHRDEEKRDDPKPESTSFFEEPRGAYVGRAAIGSRPLDVLELLAAKSREKKDAAQALSKAARDRRARDRLRAKRRAAGAASDDDFFDDELSGTEREDGGSDAENSDDDAGQVLEKLASEHAGRSASASVPKDDEELRLRCIESWTRDAHYSVEDLQLAGKQLCLALYHYCNMDTAPPPPDGAAALDNDHLGLRDGRRDDAAGDDRDRAAGDDDGLVNRGAYRSGGAKCGELAQPRVFGGLSKPILGYGVVDVDAARQAARDRPRGDATRRATSAAVRCTAELELRAILRARTNGEKAHDAKPAADENDEEHAAEDGSTAVKTADVDPADDDDDDLDAFLPSDVDPAANESDASGASGKDDEGDKAPEGPKSVLGKPKAKGKGKKGGASKKPAAALTAVKAANRLKRKETAAAKKEKKENSTAMAVAARIAATNKARADKLAAEEQLAAAAAAPAAAPEEASADDESEACKDSGSDSDPSGDNDAAATRAMKLAVAQRRRQEGSQQLAKASKARGGGPPRSKPNLAVALLATDAAARRRRRERRQRAASKRERKATSSAKGDAAAKKPDKAAGDGENARVRASSEPGAARPPAKARRPPEKGGDARKRAPRREGDKASAPASGAAAGDKEKKRRRRRKREASAKAAMQALALGIKPADLSRDGLKPSVGKLARKAAKKAPVALDARANAPRAEALPPLSGDASLWALASPNKTKKLDALRQRRSEPGGMSVARDRVYRLLQTQAELKARARRETARPAEQRAAAPSTSATDDDALPRRHDARAPPSGGGSRAPGRGHLLGGGGGDAPPSDLASFIVGGGDDDTLASGGDPESDDGLSLSGDELDDLDDDDDLDDLDDDLDEFSFDDEPFGSTFEPPGGARRAPRGGYSHASPDVTTDDDGPAGSGRRAITAPSPEVQSSFGDHESLATYFSQHVRGGTAMESTRRGADGEAFVGRCTPPTSGSATRAGRAPSEGRVNRLRAPPAERRAEPPAPGDPRISGATLPRIV